MPSDHGNTIMARTVAKSSPKAGKRNRKAALHVAVARTEISKSATVISLLGSKTGVTIAEIAASTGWQNHSVRGFLSGTVKKKLGHEITSEVIDGVRRYRIAG